MSVPTVSVRRAELRLGRSPIEVCRQLRREHPTTIFLDGAGEFEERWRIGPIVALRPERLPVTGPASQTIDRLDELIRRRRAEGGTAETGIVVLMSYEAPGRRRDASSDLPDIAVFRVDATLRFTGNGRVLATERGEASGRLDSVTDADDQAPDPPARVSGAPITSLPRERYLRAVETIRRHIGLGDIYQANLCQRFTAPYRGDVFELYAELAAKTPAPQSAFVESSGQALVSLSPEIFLRGDTRQRIETWPIKGTRPRAEDPRADAAAARELQASEKDRAELLMIVDLERNDLSRVCRPGSVTVHELAALRSYAAVHHLVARVEGRLQSGVGPSDLIRATFPGGSISGAPKIRAMQILAEIEPVDRHWFTGSLFWFGDDGSLESSILIRSWIFDGQTALLGAGGGIVADSEPELEWCEANVKARALARGLGFEPEEAR